MALRRWDWSETSQAALLLGREHGLIRGLAKGAKRDRGAFSGGIEPLTRGEFGAILKASTDLATLTDWDLREVFRGPRCSARGFLAGCFIADIIRSCVRDADPHVALFDETVAALRAMDDPRGIDPALARFQWAVLRETGYAPEPPRDVAPSPRSEDASVWAYDPAEGVFVAASGATRSGLWRVRDESVRALAALASGRGGAGVGGPKTLERVNRFLAACIARSLQERPPTMERLFGPAPGGSDSVGIGRASGMGEGGSGKRR